MKPVLQPVVEPFTIGNVEARKNHLKKRLLKRQCKAARDAAYETIINLEYDYTFRETKPRDGYIIHDPGHPDDVPIEIITTAASEAERSAKWKSSSNSDIRVTGYVRNMTKGGSDNKDLQVLQYRFSKQGRT